MAVLPILEYPDPRLRTRALPVTSFGADLQALIDDLFETMHASKAIGLAATQVDVHRAIVVLDLSGDGSDPRAYINPRILRRSGVGMVEEGCLSVPGVYDSVKRALAIRICAHDRAGVAYERDLDGMAAVCLQHEMDHLDGRLFVDRLSFLRRLKVRRALRQGRPAVAAPAPSDGIAA